MRPGEAEEGGGAGWEEETVVRLAFPWTTRLVSFPVVPTHRDRLNTVQSITHEQENLDRSSYTPSRPISPHPNVSPALSRSQLLAAMSLESIPPELLRGILLQTLPRPGSPSTTFPLRSSLLRSYALVSPLWRTIAQDELFAHPVLRDFRSTDAFISAIVTTKTFGQGVRSLALTGLDGCYDRTSRLKALLMLCEKVVQLSIGQASILGAHLRHASTSLPPPLLSRNLSDPPVSALETLIVHTGVISIPAASPNLASSPHLSGPYLPSLLHLSLNSIALHTVSPPLSSLPPSSLLSRIALPSLLTLALRDVTTYENSHIALDELTPLIALSPLLSLHIKPTEFPFFNHPETTLFDLYTSLMTLEDFAAVIRNLPEPKGPIYHLRLVPSMMKRADQGEVECLETLRVGLEANVEVLKSLKSIWIPKEWGVVFEKEVEELRKGAEERGIEIVREGGRELRRDESMVSTEFLKRCRAARDRRGL